MRKLVYIIGIFMIVSCSTEESCNQKFDRLNEEQYRLNYMSENSYEEKVDGNKRINKDLKDLINKNCSEELKIECERLISIANDHLGQIKR